MTDGTALREIAAEILTEILEKGQYTHLALFQALSKYQYLEKSDRSFLKRIVDGTVEYKIQIDYTLELNYEQTSQSHIEIDVKSKATAKLNLKEQ
jgi:16S rRNA (cytosine967-C5)-methyltransferase